MRPTPAHRVARSQIAIIATPTKVTGFCALPMPSAAKKASPASFPTTSSNRVFSLSQLCNQHLRKRQSALKRESGPRYVLGTINTGIERKRQRIASWRVCALSQYKMNFIVKRLSVSLNGEESEAEGSSLMVQNSESNELWAVKVLRGVTLSPRSPPSHHLIDTSQCV